MKAQHSSLVSTLCLFLFGFVSAASLLKGLKHANIVLLHDIIHTKETLTLVFEYVVSLHTEITHLSSLRGDCGGLKLDQQSVFSIQEKTKPYFQRTEVSAYVCFFSLIDLIPVHPC